MTHHKIRGRTCVVDVDIPERVSPAIQKLVISTIKQCLDTDGARRTTQLFEEVLQSIEIMLAHLQTDKVYTKALEDAIRKFIGIQLEEGMELGKAFEHQPDYLAKLLKRERINYKRYTQKIPAGKKRQMSEYVLASFELGEKAHTIGMLISIIVSKDVSKRYRQQMEKEIERYIG